MAGAGSLYETNRQAMLAQLRVVLITHGHPPAGVVVESILAAAAEFVRETQGSEAAFDVLTRHAEAAIAPTLAERVAQHQQQPGDR